MSRKAKRQRRSPPPPLDGVTIGVIDSLNRAQRISRSMRLALALLGGDTEFGPMLRAALDVQINEVHEAIETLQRSPAA